MAINALFYENSIPKGTGILEIPGDDGGSGLFIPLHATAITGTFHGPLGSLNLTQTFRFAGTALDRPVEAIYRFPLPGDAAVTSVVATFGDETVRTRLAERSTAEEEYDNAFKEGKKAVLVTRESADVFTLHLTGIPPDTDVVVRTTVALLARAVPNGWEIRLPVTIAPRFVRHDEDHPGVRANPLLTVVDPGYRASLDLVLQPAADITVSPPAALVTRTADETQIKIENTRPDHDLVVRWAAARGGDWLTAWAATDPDGSFTYLLGLITPPDGVPEQRIPREVIILADQSGSMSGKKWDAAAKSILAFLDDLEPDESFNLCLFSNEALWFSPRGPVAATREAIQSARRFVRTTSLFGGTELGVALEQALRQPRKSGEYSRHVLVVTDGQVTDEARLFRLAESEAAVVSPRRLSVISIDTAPNAHLALELARLGGGVAKFLSDEGDVASALEELFSFWQPPVRANAHLTVNQPGIEVAELRMLPGSENRAVDIGDLRPETPVFLVCRLPSAVSAPVLTLAARDETFVARVSPSAGNDALCTALKVAFGAGRLRALEYLHSARYADSDLADHMRELGYTVPPPDSSLYPENQGQALRDHLDRLLVDESLRYGIPSTRTAFVGVSETKGTVPSVTVAVPNALPGGWEAQPHINVHMCCDSMRVKSDSVYGGIHAMQISEPPAARWQKTTNWTIPALDVWNGEAVLIESYLIRKGTYTVILAFSDEVSGDDSVVTAYLDGDEIGSWIGEALDAEKGAILLSITVPRTGLLDVVVRNPSGAWAGREIAVSVRKDIAGNNR
ncbi:MAG: VWA domain-containing protein [Methanomicrobiaceae archaeon]|nr:VWA domain-containing protein [Methanomicrobiaceae archaeon]